MPLISVFNLRADDDINAIEGALREALTSMVHLNIHAHEVDLVPVLAPVGFHATNARVNVDLWERSALTKEVLQELATRMAVAFKDATTSDRGVKVVIFPYDVQRRGWVSL